MNKRFLYLGLVNKLIICLIISFLLAIGIYFLLMVVSDQIVNGYVTKTAYVETQTRQTISDFKKFISTHKLSIKDHHQIAKWVREKKYVKLYILKDNHYIERFTSVYLDNYWDNYGPKESIIIPMNSLNPITFSDTKAQFSMDTFYIFKFYDISVWICSLISFLSFVLSMFLFFKPTINYIINLENDIKIIEGGDLFYPISVKGNDELSSLAQSINEMRKSFIRQLENENRAKTANNELITALSHDLRTPLTALIGYLDIIEYKKYQTDENLSTYIHNSREKACQIKSLSDKLFEYFTVVNHDGDLELQTFEGNELFAQLLEDQIIIMENKGFVLDANYTEIDPFNININLMAVRRVFDNIFSNIAKYADKRRPIVIQYNIEIEKEVYVINIQNEIYNDLDQVKSTGMGLKICNNIIQYHNGKLAIHKSGSVFSVQIQLPIKRNQ